MMRLWKLLRALGRATAGDPTMERERKAAAWREFFGLPDQKDRILVDREGVAYPPTREVKLRARQ